MDAAFINGFIVGSVAKLYPVRYSTALRARKQ